jgi:hypothetical protein
LTIPFRLIQDYIDPKTFTDIELRTMGGRPSGRINLSELQELIAAEAVCGVGSKRRLRAVQLIVALDVAENRQRERLRLLRSERPLPPLDFLRRMCSSRKTTYRERDNIPDPQTGIRASWVFWHKDCRHLLR